MKSKHLAKFENLQSEDVRQSSVASTRLRKFHRTVCLTYSTLFNNARLPLVEMPPYSLFRQKINAFISNGQVATRHEQRLRTRHRTLPPRPRPRQSRCRPPRNPSPTRQDPHAPRRTLPPPFPRR